MEPKGHLLEILSDLHEVIRKYVDGDPGFSHCIELNRAAYNDFKAAILLTAPNFVPRPTGSKSRLGGELLPSGPGIEPFYLDDMRKHIARFVTRELPSHVPYEAKTVLILTTQSTWESSVKKCLDQAKKTFLATILKCAKERTHGHLRDVIMESVTEVVAERYNISFHVLSALLKAELTPSTLNICGLQHYTSKWLSVYTDAYMALSKEGNIDHGYEKELNTMADVQAYFQLSSERIIDLVAMQIDVNFFKAVGDELQSALFVKKLELSASEGAA